MLMRAQYYFTTSLPMLPTLGEDPPMTLAGFYDRACDIDEVRRAVEPVLLEHDLLLRQSVLAGETEQGEPVVLTRAQARGEEPLPEALRPVGRAEERLIGEDAMWEAYFRYVAATAAETGCEFLRRWVGFEVALRNDLAAFRAKALNLTAEHYFVAPDLADGAVDTAKVLADWSAAGDPLSAMKALDQGRWDWLTRSGGWYTFRVDEAAAYARALVLLHRWRTLTEQ